MNDALTLAAAGSAIAVALFACYRLVRWIDARRTLRAADAIARSFATAQATAQASATLREKLERYRLAKVRATLGAPSSLDVAASELVREYRLYCLERR